MKCTAVLVAIACGIGVPTANAGSNILTVGEVLPSGNILFCSNKKAVSDLVATRKAGDFSAKPKLCYDDISITFQVDAKYSGVTFPMLNKDDGSIFTAGIIIGSMRYQGETIRVYVPAHNSFRVFSQDGEREVLEPW
jgi:hypothetical protein